MLSENEENKLAMFLDVIEYSKEQNKIPRLNAYDMQWLAEKLKEVNYEAAKYAEELEKANREYALHMERCEGL